MTKTPKPALERRWGDGRAAFLARIDEIKAHIKKGHSLRSYYDAHQSELVVSYDQIRKHASRYIKNEGKTDGSTAKGSGGAASSAADPRPASRPAQPVVGAPRFQHTASNGDTDDLI